MALSPQHVALAKQAGTWPFLILADDNNMLPDVANREFTLYFESGQPMMRYRWAGGIEDLYLFLSGVFQKSI